MFASKQISIIDLGLKPYLEVWSLQEELREKRIAGNINDHIIFCEHEPVYTIGKQDSSEDFLSSEDEIKIAGIELVQCNRGGRITYHGPGQLIVYFILKIDEFSKGVKDFVSKVEDIAIDLIESYGLNPSRKSEHPGIWVDDEKIAAIGMHISQNVSIHGMAINISPNMDHYNHIIPCGIKEFGITSFEKKLGASTPSIDQVKEKLLESISSKLDCYTEKVRSAGSSISISGSSYAGISSN